MHDLTAEAEHASAMLAGRSVRRIQRHRANEVLVEFDDGTRLFIDAPAPLELSITGGADE